MRPRKLLRRISGGNYANVRFVDLVRLIEACEFELVRVSGSHHIFVHSDVPGLVNLQELAGTAKPYQVRQVLRLLERYDLQPEADS